MSGVRSRNRRVLIVDDNEDIHQDFRRILGPSTTPDLNDLDELEASILGTSPAPARVSAIELTSAFQGAEALSKVQHALKIGTPYALAFIDVRMPPGWDGIETLARLWQEDPLLQAVICSAYSDYSWESIRDRLGQTDRLLILKKPFDPSEVRQMAYALLEQWHQTTAHHRLEQALRASEAKLHALLHTVPDTLLRVAADGTCLDLKASKASLQSAPLAAIARGKLSDVLTADVTQRVLSHIGRALRESTPQVIEYEHVVDGETRRFEARIAAIDADEALVLLRDITGHKLAGGTS